VAWVGPWGTFVHIPKCGGQGLRSYLSEQMGGGYDEPPQHGVPPFIKTPAFTVVRHPISWLRSYFAYRNMHGWEVLKRADGTINHVNYWPAIFGLTQWAAGMTWGEFVNGLLDQGVDIVSTIYGMYRHPAVKIYQLEHIDVLLDDLGLTAHLPVTHVTPNKPTIGWHEREKLEHLCRRSIKDYGY